MPQYILQSGLSKSCIGVTQPRRIAAISLAQRVSVEMKTDLGDLVGYQIRFKDFAGPKTRIKYLTDGVLVQQLISKNIPYDVIVLDEIHERSLYTDLLISLLV